MLRRDFLKALAASLVIYQSPLLATTKATHHQPKVVWIVLRGALDSLHTVIPTFEPNLINLRPTLYPTIQNELLPLSKGYALHPSLINLHQWYQQKQLLPVIAVYSGYKKRSHFDGQDYLESALKIPDLDNGWLSRSIKVKNKHAIAISQSTPISLRGAKQLSNTWYPSRLPNAEHDTFSALQTLYQGSPQLLARLQEGLTMDSMLDTKNKKAKQNGNFINLSRSCGQLLKQKNTDCAMLTLGGWDTHKNQAGLLKRQLSVLDNGLQALKTELATQWDDTLVIVATEFGRTARENGTRGTDHGTASALFLAGGKINGGEVLGDWPGLNETQLYQQRDLKPTSNSFDWIAASIQQHWHLNNQQIQQTFPTSSPYQGKIFRS
ncbi:DUF1501 domain-containing protein [Psychromonas sp. RZ22]|uniref:DUF1501 domain-containing protein n=1 Tax=Psychromonas algarum TaxID=2555643 RepID=UPI0010688AD0|nr:DUF1501 domain-containing protein [Psychromonas sp. RZ22]TEW53730.1 DUF1501 domain-containing protein [Psychromonas sp. RZ22]